METRTQRYAKACFARIEAVQKTSHAADYGALALAFPVMVLQSGLSQATGFLLAKGKAHHLALLDDIASVLGQKDGTTFHRRIIQSDLATYQQLTRQTLEAAAWLKRYAQGVLKAEATNEVRS